MKRLLILALALALALPLLAHAAPDYCYSVSLPLVYGRAAGTIGDPWSWPMPTSAPTMEPVDEYD